MATALIRIRAEHLEMPGMTLTTRDVQRLCGIEGPLCQAVPDALVAAKFLSIKAAVGYARFTDVAIARPRRAKAALAPRVRLDSSVSDALAEQS